MAGEAPITAKVDGLAELTAALRGLSPKLRRQALRNGLAAAGRVVRDEARRNTPVLRAPIVRNGKTIRHVGTVRNAIVVRTSKIARRAGEVGVFVNVKPAKGVKLGVKQRGADSPVDPYYWRWLEFGRAARGASGPRARVGRVKRGGVEVTKGVRAKAAQRAVAAMPAFRMLQKGAKKLPDALRAFEQKIGPAIQKLNVKNGTA